MSEEKRWDDGMTDAEVCLALAQVPPEALTEMRWIYEGNPPRSQTERRLQELLAKDLGKFLDRMEKWEKTWRMAFKEDKRLSSEGKSAVPLEDDDGGIEQVEEWLKLWREEHGTG